MPPVEIVREQEPTLDRYDPFAPDVIAEPFPFYRVLRREAPVYAHPEHGFFVLSRYDDVVDAAQDWEHFSTTWGPGPQRIESPIASVLQSDPPDHTRLRSIIARAFTPRAVRACQPSIEAAAHVCLDALLDSKRADWIDGFAVPVPVVVIAEMLGVPQSDQALFRKWSDDVVGAIGGHVDPRDSIREFNAYFGDVVDDRRKRPKDDVVSKLLRPNAKGQTLTRDEVISFCLSLLVAGNETTTGLIGNLFLQLARRPEAWKRLREDPNLVATAVEESLRFDAPNQGLFRHTVKDVELHGVRIPEGRKVLLLFGATGRDPSHFERPEEFDVARDPNRHLAFGAGIHHCLGASLGRLEANVALRVASQRVESLTLVEERPSYVPIFFIRCPERLQIASNAA